MTINVEPVAPPRRRTYRLLPTLLACVAGCRKSPETHPVAGSVVWPGGSLEGHLVEVTLASDPKTRGFGGIEPGGRFHLERLADGKNVEGLPTGSYQARIVLNDEGDGQAKKPKVPKKYLDFQTSGWSIQVPAPGEVNLELAGK